SQPSLILASSSRYRKELLTRLRLPFTAISPDVDETPQQGESPEALALRLSVAKAMAVAGGHPGSVHRVGSGCHGGRPTHWQAGDFTRAQAQLRALSGQIVEFHSALAVTDGLRVEKADIVTRCRFRRLSDQAIDAYLRAEEPYDTAGSAKAESLGIALMESIQSDDPTAIIGLPLIALTRMLAGFGLDP
ncbi:septum formation inhibitor Maf, partial [Achromobacter xylosoxidans]|uniref:Maf family protein n=1 Tax=Alcaligenes xylosoxydans xylosoxydans TaxID=85698 RepID=UPI0009BEC011